MGILSRAVAERKSAPGFYERWLQLLSGGTKSKAGPAINQETVFRVAAAFACMRVISQGCASVPFKLYRQRMDGGLRRRLPAVEHPVYDVVSANPNSWQTSFEFRETMGLHVSLGDAYAFKGFYRDAVGELILLEPGRVRPEQLEDWSIVYHVHGRDGRVKTLSQDLIWHVRGPSWNGVMGLDVLKAAREALGLSMALEESQSLLHANGVAPSGVYSVEGTLKGESHDNLKRWIKEQAGAANRGDPLILDHSAKFIQTSMTSVDAQHKEMRNFQIEEVCRFFNVLPIMIGHTGDKANTFASAETMVDIHRVHTMAPWWSRIEQSADKNLLTVKDRAAGLYHKFSANALMRAAYQARGDYYAKALGAGGAPPWMTQDEVRELEELDPMGGTAAVLPIATNVQTPAPQGST